MIFREPESWPYGHRDRVPMTIRQWRSADDVWRLRLVREKEGFHLQMLRLDEFAARLSPTGAWQRPEMVVGVYRYFLGLDRMAVALVPLAVINALQAVDERARCGDVADMLPNQTVEPLQADRACWRRLCNLAGLSYWAGVDLRLAGRFVLNEAVPAIAPGEDTLIQHFTQLAEGRRLAI